MRSTSHPRVLWNRRCAVRSDAGVIATWCCRTATERGCATSWSTSCQAAALAPLLDLVMRPFLEQLFAYRHAATGRLLFAAPHVVAAAG